MTLFSKWICSSVMKMLIMCWKIWRLVVYCNIGFGCSEKKSLQCKAKTHISERPYFYKKKNVSVGLFSPCGLLLVKKNTKIIMKIIMNDYKKTLKQEKKDIQKSLLFFSFCFWTSRAMHTKSPKCGVVIENKTNKYLKIPERQQLNRSNCKDRCPL
jgi:hypothetical protein